MCVRVCAPGAAALTRSPGGPCASALLSVASWAPGADLDQPSEGDVAFPTHPFLWLWTSQGPAGLHPSHFLCHVCCAHVCARAQGIVVSLF